MTLIKSISGIRGTIGGKPSENLTPLDIVKFTAAYASWMMNTSGKKKHTLVLGRDARVSGPMLANIVSATLQGMGIDVIDLGLATTPTTEMAVTHLHAEGGIILTASHNPAQWNALKLLNSSGEFISEDDGRKILELAENDAYTFSPYDKLGKYSTNREMNHMHIQEILNLPYVDVEAIKKSGISVAIDCVHSVGGIVIPELLNALGVKHVIELYCEPSGLFPHNPEPLPENLTEISNLIKEKHADVGFVVDPDVDRLAILNEDGTMFGEEYTLVAIADYILELRGGGNTVSNLSSTQALKEITEERGGIYKASAVGEVNVIEKMKAIQAVIGGEGNGGIILPELHYGRDSLVGIALFLTQLATSGMKCSELRACYPNYVISKNKIELKQDQDIDLILQKVKDTYTANQIIDIDGVKIIFKNEWVHLRKSNTESIIRIYAESIDDHRADALAQKIIQKINSLF